MVAGEASNPVVLHILYGDCFSTARHISELFLLQAPSIQLVYLVTEAEKWLLAKLAAP